SGPGGGRATRRLAPSAAARPRLAPALSPSPALLLPPKEERRAEERENQIRQPHRQGRGDSSVLGPVLSRVEEEVVAEDDRERDRKPASAPSPPVRDAQG